MPMVRELVVRYQEKEVNDPRVGEPVLTPDAIYRLMSFLRFAVDEEVWAVVLDVDLDAAASVEQQKTSEKENAKGKSQGNDFFMFTAKKDKL